MNQTTPTVAFIHPYAMEYPCIYQVTDHRVNKCCGGSGLVRETRYKAINSHTCLQQRLSLFPPMYEIFFVHVLSSL